MAERAGYTARRSSPQRREGQGLSAVLLAFPFAVAAALAALIAGSGFVAALGAYGVAGALTLVTGAALIARPHRAVVRVQRLRGRLMGGGALQARQVLR